MPIEFPPAQRGFSYVLINGVQKADTNFDTTNLLKVGYDFEAETFESGRLPGYVEPYGVNLRAIGSDFEQPGLNTMAPPATILLRDDFGAITQTDWWATNRAIAGVSRDSTGAILDSCVVELFITATDQMVRSITSDASGNFSFGNPGAGPFYIVAYKAGSPDVAGTTVNTLQPT